MVDKKSEIIIYCEKIDYYIIGDIAWKKINTDRTLCSIYHYEIWIFVLAFLCSGILKTQWFGLMENQMVWNLYENCAFIIEVYSDDTAFYSKISTCET